MKAVYPPHPEEGASTCAFGRHKHCVAPVSMDGAATDLGFTRDRQFMCASRASPTCVFETPRKRLRNLGRSNIAAPHHEAGRDRECIKLIGNRFSGHCIAASAAGTSGSGAYPALASAAAFDAAR